MGKREDRKEGDQSSKSSLSENIAFFRKVSERIMAKMPLDELLNEIITYSKKLIGAEASSLLLYDAETDRLNFIIAQGSKGVMLTDTYVKPGTGIAGWVAQKKETLKIDDCYEDDRFDPSYDKKTGFHTRNMICTPMIRKGELVGVIQVINKKDDEDFDSTDVEMIEALAAQCGIAIENVRLSEIEVKSEIINRELETARKIQQFILPSSLPEINNLDLKFSLEPAKELGGDYYNVFKTDSGKYLIVIADASGKSVSASLIVSAVDSFLRTTLLLDHIDLDLVAMVTRLNRFMIKSTTSDKFATAWIGLYDDETSELECVSAGHDPTYHLNPKNGEIGELTQGGLPLGMMDVPYTSERVTLQPGDTIVVYTDGITEAMNKSEEEYTTERFTELISKSRSKPAGELLDTVLKDVHKHRNGHEQSDDITIGIARRR